MKNTFILTALMGTLVAFQCSAITVDITRSADYATSPGGEFTVTDVTDPVGYAAIYNNYAAVATYNGGFQTFCIQLGTDLLGNPQDMSLSPSGIAAGTAYLYSAFAHGTLAGYDYTPGAGRAASALQLQLAIWYLQGTTVATLDETGISHGLGFDPLSNIFVQAAIGQPTVPTVNVAVLSYLGNPSQDMLALVPDGGSTAILLGMALCGFGVASRKLRRN